jgi:hypothetical protein
MRTIIAVLLSLTLVGCSLTFQDVANRWVGQRAETMIPVWDKAMRFSSANFGPDKDGHIGCIEGGKNRVKTYETTGSHETLAQTNGDREIVYRDRVYQADGTCDMYGSGAARADKYRVGEVETRFFVNPDGVITRTETSGTGLQYFPRMSWESYGFIRGNPPVRSPVIDPATSPVHRKSR